MSFLILPADPTLPGPDGSDRELVAALASRGFVVLGPDALLDRERTGAAVERLRPRFVVSWNAARLPVGADEFALELPGDPRRLLVVMTEHPALYLRAFEGLPAGVQVACSCATHVDFLQRHWPGRFRPFFLPMPAAPVGREGEAARDLDVALFADVAMPQGISAALAGTPPAFARVVEELAATAELNPVAPLHLVYAAVLDAMGVDVPDGEWDAADRHAFARTLVYVEAAVVSKRRLALLAALDRAGVAVDVWGTGYESLAGTRHRFHASASVDERRAVLARARAVLGVSPRRAGPCEVALGAMASGAVGLVEDNPWYGGAFARGESVFTYAAGESDAAAAAVADLLSSPDRVGSLARAGRRAVHERHLWTHAARAIATQLGA
jgi:hypothetical protein